MQLRIRSIIYLAEDINGYELVDPNGRDLPRFSAGAHIGVRLGDNIWRDYSLWNDPAERRRYCIAVLREKLGEGSRRLHDEIRVGDTVETSLPRNNFPLSETAERHLLLAGGIGITPGKVVFHYDDGDPAKGLDIAALLCEPQAGTHLYYCGPAGMMAAAKAASAHWPAETVHCEYFSGPAAAPPARLEDDRPFMVRLAKRGGEYEVMPGETIIEVLRRHGVETRTSCELGYCGTCLTRYLGGEPDHRDPILGEVARQTHLLICCSRAKSRELVLDL
jgi:vanillate O-demethylase ferredoxin subunit